MSGYIRFFLAVIVLISHFDFWMDTTNPAIVAVTCFYMLSGYVVAHLLIKVFPKKARLMVFYLERILRIYPAYLFVSFLTLLFLAVTRFGNPTLTFDRVLLNLLIVPVNYYTFIECTVLVVPPVRLLVIPPAWSLATELQAYLILPFIVRFRRVKMILAEVSLVIFVAACFFYLPAEYFGYRYVPGVFFVFILGSCIYKVVNKTDGVDSFDRFFPPVCYGICLLCFIGLGLLYRFDRLYVLEVLIGVLVAMPLLYYVGRMKKKLRFDRLLGSLSYGVFLSHYLGKWIFRYWFPEVNIQGATAILFTFLFSVLLALVINLLVERPIEVVRRRLSSRREAVQKVSGDERVQA
jgi:peptidoglycan/LPS O-acetylase OafA/YrhL